MPSPGNVAPPSHPGPVCLHSFATHLSMLVLMHPLCPPRSEIDIWFPLVEQLEVPTAWWDAEADKSLLIGVFKHGAGVGRCVTRSMGQGGCMCICCCKEYGVGGCVRGCC